MWQRVYAFLCASYHQKLPPRMRITRRSHLSKWLDHLSSHIFPMVCILFICANFPYIIYNEGVYKFSAIQLDSNDPNGFWLVFADIFTQPEFCALQTLFCRSFLILPNNQSLLCARKNEPRESDKMKLVCAEQRKTRIWRCVQTNEQGKKLYYIVFIRSFSRSVVSEREGASNRFIQVLQIQQS